VLLAGLIGLAGAAPAVAQAPEPSARSTPAGIWTADGTLRDQWGFDSIGPIARRAPGLVTTPAPGNGTALLAVQHGRARPGVAVAGLLLPGTVPFDLALPDFDALLAAPASGPDHGPAGTAGMLAISLRRPADRLAGAGEFAAGAFGSRRGLGRIDLPLGTGARLGIGGLIQHDLGWLQNSRTGERLNRGQRGGVHAAFDADLAPDLSFSLDALTQRNEAGNLPSFACDPLAPLNCGGRFAGTGLRSNTDADWGPIRPDLARQRFGQRADLSLAATELAWRPPNASVRLLAGLTHQSDRLGLDLRDGRDGGYGLIARGTSTSRQLDLSTGVALGALTLTGAAGLRSEDIDRDQADTSARVVLADRTIAQSRDSRHIAAGARLLLANERLSLDAGIRLTDERLSLAVRDARPGCAPCLVPAGSDRQRQHLWTPEFALGWQQGQAQIFARSTRTARLPGWNLLARSTAELVALPAETGWQHSAGVRFDSGRALQITASGFIARTTALASPLLGIDPIAMAAAGQSIDMRNRGLDLVAHLRPVPGLDLAGTLNLQQARWQGAVPGGAPARPLYAPDLTASLAAAWTQTLPGTGADLVPRVQLDYRSRMAVAAGDVPGAPAGLAPAGLQVAAAVQLVIPEGGWLVSLECRNCLDTSLVDGAVAGLATLNPPQWWQVRFLRRF
jgi:iron complex outermembrane recepter protein